MYIHYKTRSSVRLSNLPKVIQLPVVKSKMLTISMLLTSLLYYFINLSCLLQQKNHVNDNYTYLIIQIHLNYSLLVLLIFKFQVYYSISQHFLRSS